MESISRRRALMVTGGVALGAAGALTATGLAGAAAGGTRLVVVTANIGRKHLDQRQRAIRDVRHAVKSGGRFLKPLVGWQEIGEGDDDGREPRWINEYFGKGYRNVFEKDKAAHRVPISVPSEFTVVDSRSTPVHKGLGGVTPNRVINQVVLELAADPQLKFVFANTHYVAGAFNGKQDSHEAWRRRMWQRHFDKHRDEVLEHWRAKGLPVIWTGDVNRSPMPELLPRREKRVFKRGIDQIAWVPGTNGTEISLKGTKTVDMHVDSHNARVAVLQLRRA